MKINKGTILEVSHNRKGHFFAIATRDFDTDTETFYPITPYQDTPVSGVANFNAWANGDQIPCRKSLCTIKIIGADNAH